MGSFYGSVGRVVASDTRNPRFEFHVNGNIYLLSTVLNLYQKGKRRKEKEVGDGPKR